MRIAHAFAGLAALVALASSGRAQTGRISGIVYDSLNAGPLAGALVTVVGRPETGLTDASGEFRFDRLPFGTYRLAVHHQSIDNLGVSALTSTVALADSAVTVRIVLPSFGVLWSAACGTTPPSDGSGFIFGTTRAGGTPRSSTIHLSWLDIETDGRSLRQIQRFLTTESDSTGSFALCGVPTSQAFSIQAVTDSAESGTYDIDPIGHSRVMRRNLQLYGTADRGSGAAPGTRVRGRIVGESGRPLEGITVSLNSATPAHVTDADGRFTFDSVPPGSHMLSAHRVGYEAVQRRIDVEDDDVMAGDIAFRRITLLDSVRISTMVRPRDNVMRNYVDHLRLGLGKFVTRDDLEKAAGRPLRSVLQQHFAMLDVQQQVGPAGSRARITSLTPVSRRTTSFAGANCSLIVFVDGVKQRDFDLDDWLPHQLEAVEFFSRASNVPHEFQLLGATCGVLSLITRR